MAVVLFSIVSLLLLQSVEKVTGLNWMQCLTDIKSNANATQNLVGLLNSNGDPVSNVADATALPFGAQYRLDNLMSAILTVGSPALAGYSLFITLLNSRWINRRFSHSVDYPNSRSAVSIISSLQQSPLRLHSDRARFASLVVLPENDSWWQYFSELVDYTHTWSIASATSIAWVVVAYILSVANSPSDAFVNAQAGAESTSSIWLWLIPIVMGWLQLSPKCDFNRLKAAYDRADRHARAGMADIPIVIPSPSTQRALTITAQEEDVMSPDELLTPPVFNYSRSLEWACTAEDVFLMYKAASEKARSRIPVNAEKIAAYCTQPGRALRSHWAPGVFTRMVIASCASLALQWGTVGGALIVEWFTPTVGLGCRSLSYLLYGVVSTIIWMMLLISSILAHYSAASSYRASLSECVALICSHSLRRLGKLLAIANSLWVVLMCILQYSGFYHTCFCSSNMIHRGNTAAYITIIETTTQAALAKAAWIGALFLACTSVSAFVALVNLLLDTLST
ncbi:hypothetical protein EDD22DRAFT_1048049 [Suillus occidentalis]|nr:hypothetical protein EDD22DRAFT_1048049 [Suillus occidentalis]